MEKKKILLSCFACQPHLGSEPGVGWNIARHLAIEHKVWVLTRADNRQDIEEELSRNPVPNLHFVYHDIRGWSRFWSWGGKSGAHLYYYLWQILAIPLVRQLHRETNFDLVQHVTYVKYWAPSALAFLEKVPFIWGPVGGGESAPLAFWPSCGLRGICYETLRIVAQRLAELDPFVRRTAHRATLALATTPETATRLNRMRTQSVTIFCQLGLSEEDLTVLKEFPEHFNHPIRFISIGNLIHLKGFHLGMMAFAQCGLPDAQYWMVGNGPERKRLENLAMRLGVADRVKFFGQVPRTEALKLLGHCQALIHPSLHDSGGLVCMEAMAAGRPVICLDLGGPATQVTEKTGFKVTARTPDQTVTELAEVMRRLGNTNDLWRKMDNHARQQVQQYCCWKNRAKLMNEIYQSR